MCTMKWTLSTIVTMMVGPMPLVQSRTTLGSGASCQDMKVCAMILN